MALRLADLMVDGVVLDQTDQSIGETLIEGLTLDSRTVGPGTLFAAMPGSQVDGATFIPAAIESGAVAILCATSATVPETTVPVLRADDPRRAIALMAARFHPAPNLTSIAVTGTSGKSSVVEFTRQILAATGHQAASLGTIGLVRPDGGVYGSLTTPDPITLHQSMQTLDQEGVTHLAFEASSHGIDQRRLDGVPLTAAAFTNLGRDHLDYHLTLEDYFQAKLRLFDQLLTADGTVVVNIDGEHGRRVSDVARDRGQRVITVGVTDDADLQIVNVAREAFGQAITLRYESASYVGQLNLIGSYQAENAALAAGLAIALGVGVADADAAFAAIQGVPGRLEPVGEKDGAPVVIDYAHKPEALEAALTSLRPFATRQLICVFGCGGDRDPGKRPIMGEIASRLANVVIVTDDNPRNEDPAVVRRAILDAAPGATEIADRAEAIAVAIDMAAQGDVVVIAGKGHETGQIVGGEVLPFSDQDVARTCLSRYDGGA